MAKAITCPSRTTTRRRRTRRIRPIKNGRRRISNERSEEEHHCGDKSYLTRFMSIVPAY
jgi:hypothetical protein